AWRRCSPARRSIACALRSPRPAPLRTSSILDTRQRALAASPGPIDREPCVSASDRLRSGCWRRAAARGRTDRVRLETRFGEFGGVFVPELLLPALEELEAGFLAAQQDPEFGRELNELLTRYAGRPTPLTLCRNLAADTPARIY